MSEARYFDALKRISSYQSVAHLRKHSERDWGLSFEEALEMAYENVIDDARRAVKGRRRPQERMRAGAPPEGHALSSGNKGSVPKPGGKS